VLALGAYVSLASIMAAAVVWATMSVSHSLMSTLDAAIMDGSGRAALANPDEPPVPTDSLSPLAMDHATRPAASHKAASTSASITPPRVSSDNPENDATADFIRSSGSTYRTYCVRLCDGYYFPVSFQATADKFARDEATCEASCGSPARLFVHVMPGGGPGTMVSLAGLPYTGLKTAFQFRVKYDAQCRCTAQPWAQEAKNKHLLYAAKAAAQKGNRIAAVEAKRLATVVKTDDEKAETALDEANRAAARELTALARTNRLTPPARLARTRKTTEEPKLAEASDFDRSEEMGLGVTGSSRGWRPASGHNRFWRDRVFNGN
jgi:hypothetical protein